MMKHLMLLSLWMLLAAAAPAQDSQPQPFPAQLPSPPPAQPPEPPPAVLEEPENQEPSVQTITAGTSLVLVNVTVQDRLGFPVSGLKAADFTVYDNGRPQEIASFQETIRPLHIIMLIDSSGSTYKKISLIKEGAVEFIRRMHESRPQDKLAVINFNDDVSLMAGFGNTWREKIALVQDRISANGGTALHDALYLSVRDIIGKIPGRKIVLLYTDGIDSKSMKTYSEAYTAALASDATFHVISVDNMAQALEDAEKNAYTLSRRHYYEFIQGEAASRVAEVEPQWTTNMRAQYPPQAVLEMAYRLSYQRLQRLAETTGGKFHKVATYDELPLIYRAIASELPYYYTLGFQPDFSAAKPGEFHAIELRLANPGHTPRYRRGYYYSPAPVQNK